MNKKPVWIGIAFVLVVLGVIVYSTMGLAQNEVEVCMTFQGRTSCRKASASTKEYALRSATENACAEIASGVTETIACGQSTPASVKWLK